MDSQTDLPLLGNFTGSRDQAKFFHDDTNWSDGHNLNSLKHKISRLLLVFFSQFCQVDLHENGRTVTSAADGNRYQDKRQQAWWPKVVFVAYIYCSIRFLFYIYYQYVYDFCSLKMEKFQEADADTRQKLFAGPDDTNLALIELRLMDNINASRSTLKALGAPYIHARFVIEGSLVTLLCLCYLVYFQAQIYFKINPIDMHFVRLMIAKRSEIDHCKRLVRDAVDTFILSSNNFVEVSIELSRYIVYEEQSYSAPKIVSASLVPLNESGSLREIVNDNKKAARQLRQLELGGLLWPINRSPKWVDKMSTLFNVYTLGNLVYSLIFDLLFAVLVPYFVIGFKFETDPMDLVFMVELFTLAEISVISLDFYLGLFMCNCTDQTKFCTEIHRQLMDCTHTNQTHFALSLARTDTPGPSSPGRAPQPNRSPEAIIEHLNANLLLVLMRYKIFLAQLRPVQRTFGFSAFTAIVTMFSIPVLIRIHVPYIHPAFKVFVIYFGVVVMLFADFVLVPISNFHNRAMRLYRALWSLAAHTADLAEQASGGPHAGRVYYRHTVWTILKELDHPERLADQFATSAYGMLITYPNLVKIHYWFSVVLLSMFFEIQSLYDILGERANDPLGILKYT